MGAHDLSFMPSRPAMSPRSFALLTWLNRHLPGAWTCTRRRRRILFLALAAPGCRQPAAPAASQTPAAFRYAYPFKNIQDGLHRIVDAYGPDRCFWGTDITRMPCTYRQCVTFFTEELPWLKGQDLEKVMGRSLCKWIGWNYKFT